MSEEICFSPEDQQFIDRAINFCQQMGERAVLVLAGSRSTSFADEWSDLDLWIIGDKRHLSDKDRGIYEQKRELFVDRGDFEAHWSFYDEADLRAWLGTYSDEPMWIVANSRILYGCSNTAEELKRYCQYPPAVAERKLKWMFGKYYFAQGGTLAMAARNKVETVFVAVGNIIEYLCKMCCVADKQPFPYEKWVVEAAKQTRLGVKVYPSIQRAVDGIGDFLDPPANRNWRDWTPVKELRGTLPMVQNGLKELGWVCDWVDDPNSAYFDETIRRPAP